MSGTKPLTVVAMLVAVSAIALALLATSRCTPGPSRYALFKAAGNGDLEKVRLLVRQGAQLNLQVASSFGWTPLINAIYQNKTNVSHYLVEAGADVNLPDKDGTTPLMWAVTVGDDNCPLAKDMIARGAKLEAEDKRGRTVFDYLLASPPRPEMAKILEAARLERQRQTPK